MPPNLTETQMFIVKSQALLSSLKTHKALTALSVDLEIAPSKLFMVICWMSMTTAPMEGHAVEAVHGDLLDVDQEGTSGNPFSKLQ